MLSLAILIFSAAALVRFGIGQWRAIWISAASQPLSGSLLSSTGLEADLLAGPDFNSLVTLYGDLCADRNQRPPGCPRLGATIVLSLACRTLPKQYSP